MTQSKAPKQTNSDEEDSIEGEDTSPVLDPPSSEDEVERIKPSTLNFFNQPNLEASGRRMEPSERTETLP